MAFSVIISRVIKDQKTAERLAPLAVQLRSRAAVQPGFLTDQTFSCLDCEGEYLVLSTWNSQADWETWMKSEERVAIQAQVDAVLGGETVYKYYEPVLGGIPFKL